MLWLCAAIGGYFATALSSVADKFLVSGRIEKPAVYVFLITTFSLASFALAPFGLHILSFGGMAIFLAAGILFAWSLLFLFQAFRAGEVSRVVPLVGIVSATVALAPSLVRAFVSGDIPVAGFIAFFLLVFGAGLVSFSGSEGSAFSRKALGLSFLSGVLLASFYMMLKVGEGSGANFVSALIWSRFGVFVGGLSLFLIPSCRSDIVFFISKAISPSAPAYSESGNFPEKRETGSIPTWLLFISGKTLGGIGALLIIFATYRGQVALVQAFVGVQFAFVFLIALFLSGKFPNVFEERMSRADWMRKSVAFACISLGVWLSARGGSALF